MNVVAAKPFTHNGCNRVAYTCKRSQVDQLQDELVACNDCTWNMQQVDYYIRQTHYK
mgnify:CR=1 FL=1